MHTCKNYLKIICDLETDLRVSANQLILKAGITNFFSKHLLMAIRAAFNLFWKLGMI
jgi:hypothetical protein